MLIEITTSSIPCLDSKQTYFIIQARSKCSQCFIHYYVSASPFTSRDQRWQCVAGIKPTPKLTLSPAQFQKLSTSSLAQQDSKENDDNNPPISKSKDENVHILRKRLSRYISAESLQKYREWVPRPTDIIVNSFHRSGTVWTGFIVHMIRTQCNVDSFDAVADFMPFANIAHDLGVDLNADQSYEPRLFMAHSFNVSQPRLKKGKIIQVLRDPSDILPSLHRLFTNFLLQDCDVESFADDFFFNEESAPFGTPWDNTLSWLDDIHAVSHGESHQDRMLVLFYEDLHEDRAACIERILQFMNYDLGDSDVCSLRDAVYEMSSKQSMLALQEKLCFHRLHRQFLRNNPDLKEAHYGKEVEYEDILFKLSQIRHDGGNIGDGKELHPELHAKCDEYWRRKMRLITKTNSYQEFRLKHSFLHRC